MKRKNKEWLQTIFHLRFASTLSYFLYLKAKLLFLYNSKSAISGLLKAIRFNGKNSAAISLLKKKVTSELLASLISSSNEHDDEAAARRSIVLSKPTVENGIVRKKGVLLITFTHSFSPFLNSPLFDELDNKYLFILEPSWTGYADADILYFCEKSSHLIIQSTDTDDRALINTLYPKVKTTDIGASNWVNQSKFKQIKSIQKDIDILYVANNNPVKRVYRFIEVVSQLKERLPNLRVFLICAGWGGNSEEVKAEIESKGLGDTICLEAGLPQDKLIELYNRAKCSVLFSLKEGSNRVLFESMFCNTPIFCIAENRGVNKSYINEFTGTIAYDSSCVDALSELVVNYKKLAPREWAKNNISAEKSTQRLEKLINVHFGDSVISNLKVKINDPEVNLLNEGFVKFNSFEEINSIEPD